MFYVAKPRAHQLGVETENFPMSIQLVLWDEKYIVHRTTGNYFYYDAMVPVGSYESYLPIICLSNINNNNK